MLDTTLAIYAALALPLFYLLVRVASHAYFKSKLDYHKQLLTHHFPKEETNGQSTCR